MDDTVLIQLRTTHFLLVPFVWDFDYLILSKYNGSLHRSVANEVVQDKGKKNYPPKKK